jgi:hypothetical protein
LIKQLLIGCGDRCTPGQNNDVYRRVSAGVRNVMRPEAFPNKPLQPVSLHRPFVHFAGNSHAQAGVLLLCPAPQHLEAGIR